MKAWAMSVLLAAAALGACGSDAPAPPVDGGAPAFLNTLATPDDFARLSDGQGGEVKYLAPVAGRAPVPPLSAACTFQNMRQHAWHLQFLQSLPELAGISYDAYLSLVMRPSRRLWGGAIKPWAGVAHPRTGAAGVMVYGIYGEPGAVDAAAIRALDQRLKDCVPFARELLVFVPQTSDQSALLARERAELTAAGIASLFPEDLVPGSGHLVHSPGEGYGTLRIVPRGQPLQDYGPRDVVVVESAPNDISVVAGLITRNPQNDLGHVNLRLREKAIPNVTVPGIYDAAWARVLDGTLVHLLVSVDGFTLVPATLADAQAFWEAHRPNVRPPEADLTVTALASFQVLRATDARAYGAKAANLGELSTVLDRPNRNDGFGIPFARYRDFAGESGLLAAVEAFLADPRTRTDAPWKRARLKELRQHVRAGAFPQALFDDLVATITQVFGAGTQRLRFRSSTNVEDLDAFTGAGLYESKTGCLADDLDDDQVGPSRCLTAAERAALEQERAQRQAELDAHPDRTYLQAIITDLTEDLSEEKPVRDAVRKVWASLWEERAFDEREYYGIDHRRAFMGIAVNPSFVLERASAVAVTNLHVDRGAPLYRLNSQVGSESVVQPEDPTAIAEALTFRRAGEEPAEVMIQIASNRAPGAVWPAEKLTQLGRLLFRVHDHFATAVYPTLVPLHLDVEVKHSAEGDVVIKQVRPFFGREP
jgi:hypothetical protein